MKFQTSVNNRITVTVEFWKLWTSITITVFHYGTYIHADACLLTYIYFYNNNAAFFRLHSNLTQNNGNQKETNVNKLTFNVNYNNNR